MAKTKVVKKNKKHQPDEVPVSQPYATPPQTWQPAAQQATQVDDQSRGEKSSKRRREDDGEQSEKKKKKDKKHKREKHRHADESQVTYNAEEMPSPFAEPMASAIVSDSQIHSIPATQEPLLGSESLLTPATQGQPAALAVFQPVRALTPLTTEKKKNKKKNKHRNKDSTQEIASSQPETQLQPVTNPYEGLLGHTSVPTHSHHQPHHHLSALDEAVLVATALAANSVPVSVPVPHFDHSQLDPRLDDPAANAMLVQQLAAAAGAMPIPVPNAVQGGEYPALLGGAPVAVSAGVVSEKAKKKKAKGEIVAQAANDVYDLPDDDTEDETTSTSKSKRIIKNKVAFTPEEDAVIKSQIQAWLDGQGLSEAKFQTMLRAADRPAVKTQLRPLWKQLHVALPARGQPSVVSRVHVLWREDTPGNSTQTTQDDKGRDVVIGSFTDEEVALLEKVVQQHCADHEWSADDFKEKVWKEGRTKEVKACFKECYAAVPYRKQHSVYNHIRRKYSPYEKRARWTEEEDQELERLLLEKGKVWKDIGKAIGRMPEDVRDRYRNYLVCGDKRNDNRWTREEEIKLRDAVHLAVANVGGDMEKINWGIVSANMGGARSRLQCRWKWVRSAGSLKADPNAVAKFAEEGEDGEKGAKEGIPLRAANKAKPRWMAGDSEWLLNKIRDSGVHHENLVPWTEIKASDPNTWWKLTDYKKAFRDLRATKKKEVKTGMEFQEIVRMIMEDLVELDEEVRVRGVASEEGRSNLSSEFVNDEDDEDEEMA
ncbi:hypothetical protein YB2330_001791 [Saitoella coloradoensis]